MKFKVDMDYYEVEVSLKIKDWIYLGSGYESLYFVLHMIDLLIGIQNKKLQSKGLASLFDVLSSFGVTLQNPELLKICGWTKSCSDKIVYTTQVLNDYETVRIIFYTEPFFKMWFKNGLLYQK